MRCGPPRPRSPSRRAAQRESRRHAGNGPHPVVVSHSPIIDPTASEVPAAQPHQIRKGRFVARDHAPSTRGGWSTPLPGCSGRAGGPRRHHRRRIRRIVEAALLAARSGDRHDHRTAATHRDHVRPAVTAGQRPRPDFWYPTVSSWACSAPDVPFARWPDQRPRRTSVPFADAANGNFVGLLQPALIGLLADVDQSECSRPMIGCHVPSAQRPTIQSAPANARPPDRTRPGQRLQPNTSPYATPAGQQPTWLIVPHRAP
jgi:hypothetical protein